MVFLNSTSNSFRDIWSQIYFRGPYAPWTPPIRKIFVPEASTSFTTSNCVFNFNFLAPVVYEIIGGPKFTLRGPAPPGRPLTETF